MSYDERWARAGTRAAPYVGAVAAVVLCVGAFFGLYAAIVGPITHQIPMKRAVVIGAIALVMLATAAFQFAMGRRARRIAQKWDAAGPSQGVERNDG